MAWSTVVAVAAVSMAWAAAGCESDSCNQETVDRAVAFLDAHQSCETDDDCVVVSDACGEIPGGFCGQLSMNSEGAESGEWQALERAIADCAPSSCTVCDAALVPTCTAGSCRGR
jgi:hypothetical protein